MKSYAVPSKKKLAFLLILWMIVCSGIYIAAVKAYFVPITPIYMALSVIFALLYTYLFIKNALAAGRAVSNGKQMTKQEQAKFDKRAALMKYLLLLLVPVILVLLADYMYITVLHPMLKLKLYS